MAIYAKVLDPTLGRSLPSSGHPASGPHTASAGRLSGPNGETLDTPTAGAARVPVRAVQRGAGRALGRGGHALRALDARVLAAAADGGGGHHAGAHWIAHKTLSL